MAVIGLLLRREFGEGLLNLGEVEHAVLGGTTEEAAEKLMRRQQSEPQVLKRRRIFND